MSRFPGYDEILNEILHPRRGIKGYPGFRTVAEQRDIVAGLIRTLTIIDDERARADADVRRLRDALRIATRHNPKPSAAEIAEARSALGVVRDAD